MSKYYILLFKNISNIRNVFFIYVKLFVFYFKINIITKIYIFKIVNEKDSPYKSFPFLF